MVVSGETEALDQLEAQLEADGVRARPHPVSYASHSPQVEAVREELVAALAGIEPRPSEIPLYSTVTGEPADTAEMDAEHWFRNLRQTVLFEPAIGAMAQAGIDALIEVGPHPILLAPAAQTLDSLEDGGGRRRSAHCAATRAAGSDSWRRSPRRTRAESGSTGSRSSRAPAESRCPPTPSSASATG